MARGDSSPEESLLAILRASEQAEFGRISNLSGLSLEEAQKSLNKLVSEEQVVKLGEDGPYTLLLLAGYWNELLDMVRNIVQAYHNQYPLRKGMLKEEFRKRLKIHSQHFRSVIKGLVDRGVLVEEDALVKLPVHEVRLTKKHHAEIDAFLKTLAENTYVSPSKVELGSEIIDILWRYGVW